MRRITRAALTLATVLLMASPAYADKYLRAGASGSGTGADWTNAYATCAAANTGVARGSGETIWIADGSYGNCTFNKAASGSARITTKKATTASHGTETGWSAAYGDGVAEMTRLVITTDYWTIDGVVGQWASDLPNYVAYGITIKNGSTSAGSQGVTILLGASSTKVNFIELKHIETAQTNTPFVGTWGQDQYLIRLYAHDTLLSYIWAHDSGSKTISNSGQRTTYEYSVFERPCHSQVAMGWSPSEHCEIQKGDPNTSGHILRYSYLRDWRSTGGWIEEGTNNDIEIYGNVFETTGYWGGSANDGNGALNGTGGNVYSGWKIYNNTFRTAYGCRVVTSFGTFTNTIVKNNLFYNCTMLSGGAAQVGGNTRSHNWYYGSGTQSETSIQNGSGDPFVDSADHDYHLTAGTTAGDTSIGSTYDEDADGVTRGADATWDRGAFEYEAGGAVALNIITTTLDDGTVGVAYSETILAGGGDGTYTFVNHGTGTSSMGAGACTGLTITTSSNSGLVAGTPTTSGTCTVTYRVTDGLAATDTQAISFDVTAISITTAAELPAGIVGSVYTPLTFEADGGTEPYVWTVTVGAAPGGMALSSAGVLSGTPTTAGQTTFTVTVTDDNDVTATLEVTILIVEPTAGLVDTLLTARYYFDEAASGSAPTTVFDHASLGTSDLTINYGSGNLSYLESGSNSGLESTSISGAQAAARVIDDELDDLRTFLHGAQTITIELVMRVDVRHTGGQSRMFGVIDESSDVGRLMIKAAQGSDNLILAFNGSNVEQWALTTTEAAIWHVVIDTTQAAADDRVKVYKNGSVVTSTTSIAITQNTTLDLSTDQQLIAMNRIAGDRSFDGRLAYAALYAHAFSVAEVTHNYTELTADDDAPVSSTPGARFRIRIRQ
jgi:hypothetical protein